MVWTRSDIHRLSVRSLAAGVAIFGADAALYLGALATMLASHSAVVRLACTVPACLGLCFLFLVGHDACHNSLTPSRRLNHIIARLAFFPTYHPVSLWELGHNLTHHRFTNVKGRDYVFEPLTKPQYDALSPSAQARYRFLRGVIGLHFYWLVEIWWKRMIAFERAAIPRRTEYVLDRRCVGAFFGSQLCVIAYVAGAAHGRSATALIDAAGLFVTAILLPFIGWNILGSHLIFVHHTHPRVRWYPDEDRWSADAIQLENTVHAVFPWPVNILLHRIMEHTAHHVSVAIPMYRLNDAQSVLEEAHGNRVIRVRWTPRAVFDTARACRLYDVDRARWLDFDGAPTT
jgi:acyl-lipid omega-6 desaturase (Delta-12 desaturase)